MESYLYAMCPASRSFLLTISVSIRRILRNDDKLTVRDGINFFFPYRIEFDEDKCSRLSDEDLLAALKALEGNVEVNFFPIKKFFYMKRRKTEFDMLETP